jgi:hypothetical protein
MIALKKDRGNIASLDKENKCERTHRVVITEM